MLIRSYCGCDNSKVVEGSFLDKIKDAIKKDPTILIPGVAVVKGVESVESGHSSDSTESPVRAKIYDKNFYSCADDGCTENTDNVTFTRAVADRSGCIAVEETCGDYHAHSTGMSYGISVDDKIATPKFNNDLTKFGCTSEFRYGTKKTSDENADYLKSNFIDKYQIYYRTIPCKYDNGITSPHETLWYDNSSNCLSGYKTIDDAFTREKSRYDSPIWACWDENDPPSASLQTENLPQYIRNAANSRTDCSSDNWSIRVVNPYEDGTLALGLFSPADAFTQIFENESSMMTTWIKGKPAFTSKKFVDGDENSKPTGWDGWNDWKNKNENVNYMISRLAPEQYHRYHVPFTCKVLQIMSIKGNLYSVSPEAIKSDIPVYTDNTRVVLKVLLPNSVGDFEYGSLSEQEQYCAFIVIIGATCVGSIQLSNKNLVNAIKQWFSNPYTSNSQYPNATSAYNAALDNGAEGVPSMKFGVCKMAQEHPGYSMPFMDVAGLATAGIADVTAAGGCAIDSALNINFDNWQKILHGKAFEENRISDALMTDKTSYVLNASDSPVLIRGEELGQFHNGGSTLITIYNGDRFNYNNVGETIKNNTTNGYETIIDYGTKLATKPPPSCNGYEPYGSDGWCDGELLLQSDGLSENLKEHNCNSFYDSDGNRLCYWG